MPVPFHTGSRFATGTTPPPHLFVVIDERDMG